MPGCPRLVANIFFLLVSQINKVFQVAVLLDMLLRALDHFGGLTFMYSRLRRTNGLTMVSTEPSTRFLYLIRLSSGSTPVVTASMKKLIVPVGASRVTCALR